MLLLLIIIKLYIFFMALTRITAITISWTVPIYDNLISFDICVCVCFPSLLYLSLSLSICFPRHRSSIQNRIKPRSRKSHIMFTIILGFSHLLSSRNRFYSLTEYLICFIIIIIIIISLTTFVSYILTNLFHTCVDLCRHKQKKNNTSWL